MRKHLLLGVAAAAMLLVTGAAADEGASYRPGSEQYERGHYAAAPEAHRAQRGCRQREDAGEGGIPAA